MLLVGTTMYIHVTLHCRYMIGTLKDHNKWVNPGPNDAFSLSSGVPSSNPLDMSIYPGITTETRNIKKDYCEGIMK